MDLNQTRPANRVRGCNAMNPAARRITPRIPRRGRGRRVVYTWMHTLDTASSVPGPGQARRSASSAKEGRRMEYTSGQGLHGLSCSRHRAGRGLAPKPSRDWHWQRGLAADNWLLEARTMVNFVGGCSAVSEWEPLSNLSFHCSLTRIERRAWRAARGFWRQLETDEAIELAASIPCRVSLRNPTPN